MDSILGTQTNLALQPVDKYGFQMATRSGKFYVSNNQNALKNGIVVEQKLAENEKLSKTDNLGNQNQLLSLVAHTSVTKRLFKSFPVQLTGSTGQTAEAGLEFKNLENGNQFLKLSVTVPKNQQAYLSLFKMQGSISQISVYKGKQLIENYNPNLVGQYI
ncbi:YfhO family protein, partial [Enterococcus faecium]|nr:YfhO family protein [Enterococcus faecium]